MKATKLAAIDSTCAKCGVGKYDSLMFVPSVSEDTGASRRTLCVGYCPPKEHLHMACGRCRYWVVGDTVEAPTLPPTCVTAPYVGGTGTVGSTLSCTMGTWTGEPTAYAYKWLRDTATVGTDSNTYVVADTDVGHNLSCVVTASNGGGAADSPPSNLVKVLNGGVMPAATTAAKAKKVSA
jgi:hypothetical protein